jgi:5'-3' exoribonuclease 2
MGVPSFFRKLIKKYKIVKNNIDRTPRVLYIDANCLFHPQCFKELERNKNLFDQKILFDRMVNRIIRYIDYLIRFTNPTEMVYIAVDGVAPLAKINQQRSRRFGYANNYRHNVYKRFGVEFNDSWSNIVITPGTDFMYDLHLRLNDYYNNTNKSKDHPTYQIIYDSYLNSGEGEHKILQHMKMFFKNKKINQDEAIIIYGLDADLIFLSMASRIDNIYLLREAVHFAQTDNNNENLDNPDDSIEEELCYADINFARDSINVEFNGYYLRSIEYKTEPLFENEDNKTEKNNVHNNRNFINDYVFVCFLLGNDFIPHLPSIDINTDGLESILGVYMDTYQMLGSNLITIVDDLVAINDMFLFEMIARLASKEEDYFCRILPDHIRRHKNRRCYETAPHKKTIWNIENLRNVRIIDPIKLGYGDPIDWKYRYYSHYFKTNEHIDLTISDVCHNYLEGLVWATKYYFEKCPTWRWQYKYTHAPFLSDIMIYLKNHIKNGKRMKDFETKYEDPVNIYTQLVSCIPSVYSHLLPRPLQYLSTSVKSPIIDLFPLTYRIDMINKTLLYKCIPIIPYLDIERVDQAVGGVIGSLTAKDLIKIKKN